MLEQRLLMANERPSDLVVFPYFVDENQPIGTVVGQLIATDPDPGDTFRYSLVDGDGNADNDLFIIDGDELKTAAALDHEARPTCSIRVRVTDSAGATLDRRLTIFVDDVNEAPRSLRLSFSTVAENQPVGTVVGVLSATDPDKDDTLTYSLVAGAGGANNGSFTIDGDGLVTAAKFDFEVKATYNVRVAVTDAAGLSFEEPFVVTVTGVNEAPTAAGHSYSAIQNTPLPIAAPGILQGARDPENAPLVPLLVVGSGPETGVVELYPDGSFGYEPNENFVGTDKFQYRVFDGQFYSDPTTVNITVDYGADPVLVIQTPSLVIGENNLVLTIVEGNLLVINFANRQVVFADPVSALNSITVLGVNYRGDRMTIDSSVSHAGVLPGGVTFNGGSGHLPDTLVLRGASAADAFAVSSDSATVNSLAVRFSNIERLELNGGGGDDTYEVSALPVNTVISAPPINPTISDSTDNEWLDFSGAASGVRIDLGRTSAQAVFGRGGTLTIKGTIENVRGTDWSDTIKGNSANNVLLGGDGDDWLDGGAGRDLLIGGADFDTLRGGAGDDILIGGTTAFDDNVSALAAIMREWTSSRPFRKRYGNLATGLFPLVRGQTVLDDAVRDDLFGGQGQDWFFDFSQFDVAHDRERNER
jgi:Ca2+-binding RTX toxin-like protein